MSLYASCEWEQIEKMLRMVLHRFPSIHHRSFDLARRACEMLFIYPNEIRKRPTLKQIKIEMERFHEIGLAFIAALDALSPETKTAIDDRADMEAEELAEQIKIDDPRRLLVCLPTFDEVKADVMLMTALATSPEEWLIVPRKAPEAKRRAFIRTMATVYEKTTGQPAMSGVHRDTERNNIGGSFFDLVYDCLVAAGKAPHSPRALEIHIYRTLHGRKPRIDPWMGDTTRG